MDSVKPSRLRQHSVDSADVCTHFDRCQLQYLGRDVRRNLYKHNTSNDMFSRCKSVQEMATGKSDDQFIRLDNKLKLGPR